MLLLRPSYYIAEIIIPITSALSRKKRRNLLTFLLIDDILKLLIDDFSSLAGRHLVRRGGDLFIFVTFSWL